jgi:hypothetical protein
MVILITGIKGMKGMKKKLGNRGLTMIPKIALEEGRPNEEVKRLEG